jgi:hypothetical protein
MELSIGPVTDYLFGLARAAVSGVLVDNRPAIASDGPVEELTAGAFVVGLDVPPPDESGSTTSSGMPLVTIGARIVKQDSTVPCYIDCTVPGIDQKAARDAAESIFNPFWTAFLADPSLGGLLAGGVAQISTLTSTPFREGTAAEPGRRQIISFGVNFTELTGQ